MTNYHNVKKSGTRKGSYRLATRKSERGSNSQLGKLVAVECKGKHSKKILSPPRSEQRLATAVKQIASTLSLGN